MLTQHRSTNSPASPSTTASEPAAATRRKPLRTYGRQSAWSERADSEPAAKRRRVAEPATPTSPPKDLPPQLPPNPTAKRGTILSFFKPLTPAPSTETSPSCPSPLRTTRSVEQITTPPSSPPIVTRSRERRRLTTRPDLYNETRSSSEAASPRPESDLSVPDGERVAADETSPFDEPPGTDTLPEFNLGVLGGEGRSALSELLSKALGARAAAEDPGAGKKEKNQHKKRPKKELVQATLNLSTRPGPRFTLCKSCGLLYNHLNDKDRKTHARQHAAYTRSKPEVNQILEV